ncbi:MAG: site-specific DNA-methyltransferase, partial [Sediminibacterium sp.]
MNKIVGPIKSTGKSRKKSVTGEYIHGDSRKMLDTLILKKRKFQLIMTSPPYNMDKEYEKSQPLEKYSQEIEVVIKKLSTLLDAKGSICWQVGNYIDPKTKEIIPLDIFYHELFKKQGFILRNRIIWHFESGLHASNRFSGRYETIMWYTKSDNYIFNLDSVRIPSKYPGKTHYKGLKKGQISGNPRGKNPSDIWKIIQDDWDKEIWDIPNVKANHKEKTIHPCQYPVELVERCVLALTNKNDYVLDPYAGVGSTIIASIKNDRNAIGIEKYKKYINLGHKRIEAFKQKHLKLRELGTPV